MIPPLCFQEWIVLCTHTQTSQHIKHMFTIHKGSSLPEKSVLLRRLSPASPNPTLRGFELGVFIQLLSRGIKHGPFGYHATQENSIHPLQTIDSLDEMTLLYVVVGEFPSLRC